jgi:hypothetical protein
MGSIGELKSPLGKIRQTATKRMGTDFFDARAIHLLSKNNRPTGKNIGENLWAKA